MVGTWIGRETRLTDGGGGGVDGDGVMFGEVKVADERSDEAIKLGSSNKKSCVSICRWHLGFEGPPFSLTSFMSIV